MLFHDVSKEPPDPGGSDENNSENYINWGYRHRLRKGRSNPEASCHTQKPKAPIRGKREPNPRECWVSWERTQMEKKSSKNPVPKEK